MKPINYQERLKKILDKVNLSKKIVKKKSELTALLKNFEYETDPTRLKEHLLGIAQVYYDGLIKNKTHLTKKDSVWEIQEKALDAIFQGLRMILIPFYEKKEVPIDDAKNLVISYDSTLLKYSINQEPKNRHLREFEDDVERHYEVIKQLKETKLKGINLVISIASGAFEPSVLDSYALDAELLPVRYSRISRTDKEVKIPGVLDPCYFHKKISGSKVLIIEDVIMTGASIREITRWVARYDPKEIYCLNIKGGPNRIEWVLPSKKINSTPEHTIIYKADLQSLKKELN